MDISRRGLLGGAVAGAVFGTLPGTASAGQGIDWAEFLGAQDMVWQRVPRA
jgi:hypothetical protein